MGASDAEDQPQVFDIDRLRSELLAIVAEEDWARAREGFGDPALLSE